LTHHAPTVASCHARSRFPIADSFAGRRCRVRAVAKDPEARRHELRRGSRDHPRIRLETICGAVPRPGGHLQTLSGAALLPRCFSRILRHEVRQGEPLSHTDHPRKSPRHDHGRPLGQGRYIPSRSLLEGPGLRSVMGGKLPLRLQAQLPLQLNECLVELLAALTMRQLRSLLS
jgi:hypothetical protein